MKRLIALTTILLVTLTVSAQDGKRIYKKYSDNNDVSAVCISPSMYKLIGKIPAVHADSSDFDLTKLIESFDGFYMLNSTNPETGREIKEEVEKFVKNKNYETLMEVTDQGQKVKIYASCSNDVINSFVLLNYGVHECVFISLDGVISRSELEKAIAKPNAVSYKQTVTPNIVILK